MTDFSDFMKTSAVVSRHSDTKCLPIGNRDEGKTQRKVEGWIKSMTDRGGGTEGMLGMDHWVEEGHCTVDKFG